MAPGQERQREYLYEQIAEKSTRLIQHGTLAPGERIPSVRKLSRQEGVSISTVLQAYYWLESQGLIEAHPQSGFYVRLHPQTLPPEPEKTRPRMSAVPVGVDDLVTYFFETACQTDLIPLGAALPSPELFPNRKLHRLLSSVARRDPEAGNTYQDASGEPELRRQIARRSLSWGGALDPREMVITCGCTEALHLSLRAVAQPGEVVAVESPTYFAVLQIIETLGLKAVEIPTDPREGICVESLEAALKRCSIRACVVMSNCHDPLGTCMPEENKEKLVALATRRKIPLIEDDVYGDLHFGPGRPKTLKAFDREGWVLFCSSFSKTLAPGYRIGWTAPGRFRDEVLRMKRSSTLTTWRLPQLAIAEFLESGGYDHHLRKIRKAYACQVQRMSQSVRRFFPEGTRVTRPGGGFVLWVQLPRPVDSLELFSKALQDGVSVAPGPLFSPCKGYRNFVRINCGVVWSEKTEQGLLILGRLAQELADPR